MTQKPKNEEQTRKEVEKELNSLLTLFDNLRKENILQRDQVQMEYWKGYYSGKTNTYDFVIGEITKLREKVCDV